MSILYVENKPLTFSPEKPKGAAAHLAYRGSENLTCCRSELEFDFSAKKSNVNSFFVGDVGSEMTRQKFANELERAEKKKSGTFKDKYRYGRELIIAQPFELSAEQRTKATKRIAEKLAQKYQILMLIDEHKPDAVRRGEKRTKDSKKNFHAHITLTERKVKNGVQYGTKIRELNRKEFTAEIKEIAKQEFDKELIKSKRNPIPEKSPGQIPQVHQGPEISALERKGIKTRIGNINRLIKEHNKSPSPELKRIIEQSKEELKQPEKKKKGFHVLRPYQQLNESIRESKSREFTTLAEQSVIEKSSSEISKTDRKIADFNRNIRATKREIKNREWNTIAEQSVIKKSGCEAERRSRKFNSRKRKFGNLVERVRTRIRQAYRHLEKELGRDLDP
jgi:hypothetical protein